MPAKLLPLGGPAKNISAQVVRIEWNGDRIENILDRAIDVSLKRGALEGVRTAKSLVPVKTGELKRSIHDDGIRKLGNVAEVTIEADARGNNHEHYAGYVEFGTRYHRAQPFMRPSQDVAFDAVKTTLRTIMRRATR